jgi:hypothetical protein
MIFPLIVDTSGKIPHFEGKNKGETEKNALEKRLYVYYKEVYYEEICR